MQYEAVLTDIFHRSFARMIGDGIPYPEAHRLKAEIEEWPAWFSSWADTAKRFERLGDEALAAEHSRTAGDRYWQSSMFWHYAQFLWFHNEPERHHGQAEKVRMYGLAAPLLDPPAEPLEVPFEDTVIPGFLRVPRGTRGPVPLALLIGGLESTKEESRLFEDLCLTRGIATVAFDGPGQGEYFAQRGYVNDFERYASAILDQVLTDPRIRPTDVGMVGRSLGGYYAARVAAHDPRIAACVCFGAIFDMSAFDAMESVTQLGFLRITALEDLDEAKRTITTGIDLKSIVAKITCPLYVLHGAKDALISVAQATRLAEEAVNAEKVTLVIPPEGDHCCHNMHHLVRPAMADWLEDQFKKRRIREHVDSLTPLVLQNTDNPSP